MIPDEMNSRRVPSTLNVGFNRARPYPIPIFNFNRPVSQTYKKIKKTGKEKLRCKLGGLDADLVDDVVALGTFPCTMEFRTECNE